MPASDPGSRLRRAAVGVLIAAAIVGAALLVCPVRTTILRAGIVGTAVAAVAAGRVILSQRMRRVLDIAAGAAVVWIVATAEPAPPSPQRFVEALRTYEGTTYVWGGETARGIDCSGLIRAALIDTQIRAGRPGAALRLWWRDVAARDLGAAHPWLFGGPERRESIAAAGASPPRGAITSS